MLEVLAEAPCEKVGFRCDLHTYYLGPYSKKYGVLSLDLKTHIICYPFTHFLTAGLLHLIYLTVCRKIYTGVGAVILSWIVLVANETWIVQTQQLPYNI